MTLGLGFDPGNSFFVYDLLYHFFVNTYTLSLLNFFKSFLRRGKGLNKVLPEGIHFHQNMFGAR